MGWKMGNLTMILVLLVFGGMTGSVVAVDLPKPSNGIDKTVETDSNKKPTLGKLTITTNPDDAQIKIMNISEKYHDGILLPQHESYDVLITRNGFHPYRKQVLLQSHGLTMDVILSVKNSTVKKDSSTETNADSQEEIDRLREAIDKQVKKSRRAAYWKAVRDKISEHWVLPENDSATVACDLVVQQQRDGTVHKVEVRPCDVDESYIEAIENAVWQASPLPVAWDENFKWAFTLRVSPPGTKK